MTVPLSTLLPHDKGTALVLLLACAGVALLAATGRSRDAGSATLAAGIGAALLAVFVASAPGLAGEDGVPLTLVSVVVVAVGLAARDRRPETLLAVGLVATATLLVAVAPADTSGFLSGDPPHARERGFLVAGSLLLGATCLASALLARRRRAPLAVAAAATVLAGGALAHGYALLAPLV